MDFKMTEMGSSGDNNRNGDAGKPQAALLTDDQIKRLKVAISIMSALLVIGVFTLISRVIYLASNRSDTPARTAQPAVDPTMAKPLADVKLPLPPGARLTATSLSGNRLIAQYAGGAGDGIVILDLATGQVLSHVRVDARP